MGKLRRHELDERGAALLSALIVMGLLSVLAGAYAATVEAWFREKGVERLRP